jgi:hypothetical protein
MFSLHEITRLGWTVLDNFISALPDMLDIKIQAMSKPKYSIKSRREMLYHASD